MEEYKDISKKRWFSNSQVVTIVIAAVMATFALAMIYGRFLIMEKEIQSNTDRIEYVNDRLSRKIGETK